MEFVHQYVDQFAELFRGNTSSHGVHVPEKETTTGKKASGSSFTKRERLTQDHYLKHLHGEESVGVIPLDSNGNVRFAVIDVDIYPLNPQKILGTLRGVGLPFVGFRSKSGGLHLYCFMAQDTAASKLLPLLQIVRQILGLDEKTEIFPKQTRLVANQVGNWINLPYYRCKDTKRYAYGITGEALSLADAMELCISSKVELKELSAVLEALPMAQAPPCLQTIFLSGGADEGERNEFLFNCATYLKARFGEDFSENLHLLNSKTDNPVPYEELDRTVISSHNKGDYSYQCSQPVLSEFCDKTLCVLRKYGKGSGTVSDLSFEQLVQVQSSTPYYKWYVNGAEMIFFSETELISQQKFRELCLRLLHKVPSLLKEKAWSGVLNRALANVKIEMVEADDDLSEDSLWLSKVTEFFSRRKALRPSQVEDGLVWQDEEKNLYFKGAKVLEHLEKTGMFRHFKKTQHRNLLKRLGAKTAKLRYPDSGKSARSWTLNLTELQDNGVFLDIETVEEDYEKVMTPLDFIGEEKY